MLLAMGRKHRGQTPSVYENNIVNALESAFGVDSKQSRETFGGVHRVENPRPPVGCPMGCICCALRGNRVVLAHKTFVDDDVLHKCLVRRPEESQSAIAELSNAFCVQSNAFGNANCNHGAVRCAVRASFNQSGNESCVCAAT